MHTCVSFDTAVVTIECNTRCFASTIQFYGRLATSNWFANMMPTVASTHCTSPVLAPQFDPTNGVHTCMPNWRPLDMFTKQWTTAETLLTQLRVYAQITNNIKAYWCAIKWYFKKTSHHGASGLIFVTPSACSEADPNCDETDMSWRSRASDSFLGQGSMECWLRISLGITIAISSLLISKHCSEPGALCLDAGWPTAQVLPSVVAIEI